MKPQHLQNFSAPPANSPRHTLIRDMRVALQIPDVYDYITKLCRQQAQVLQNHENTHVQNIGQGEAQQGKYRFRIDSRQDYGC
jgi:hypothetical protein